MDHKPHLLYTTEIIIPQTFFIQTIEEKDIDYIIEMSVKLFSEAAKYEYSGLFFYCMTDFTISKKAVLDGKIIGCYLLNDESVHSYEMNRLENLDRYKTLRGLQGVALGIMKEYRGLSYGRQLRDSAHSLNEYDYIWGFQGKSLNNLGSWLGYGRRLVGETEYAHVTFMDIKDKAAMIA